MIKVYMDDTRTCPEGWVHIRNVRDVVSLLLVPGLVSEMSLDHDMGATDPSDDGSSLVRLIEEAAHDGHIDVPPWRVHSANPVGAARMRLVLSKFRPENR